MSKWYKSISIKYCISDTIPYHVTLKVFEQLHMRKGQRHAEERIRGEETVGTLKLRAGFRPAWIPDREL